MKESSNIKAKVVGVAGVLVAGFGFSASALDSETNLLEYNNLGSGSELRTDLLNMNDASLETEAVAFGKFVEVKCGEGKCGEGSCGTEEAKSKAKKTVEGAASSGKSSVEGKVNSSKSSIEGKMSNGKSTIEKNVSEGKSEINSNAKTIEGKAGEAKCGEGKCGENTCGGE